MNLKIKRLHPDAVLPTHATDGAACIDLRAIDCQPTEICPGHAATFRTGLAFEVPPGSVMLIFSRSGHGFQFDTRLANGVGVIDSDYRGEVKVRLTCDGGPSGAFAVNPGDRIAQAMILALPFVQITETTELSETARGAGGFGSTGNN